MHFLSPPLQENETRPKNKYLHLVKQQRTKESKAGKKKDGCLLSSATHNTNKREKEREREREREREKEREKERKRERERVSSYSMM
jgi:hypothetical protein